jgi:hypothetical protein
MINLENYNLAKSQFIIPTEKMKEKSSNLYSRNLALLDNMITDLSAAIACYTKELETLKSYLPTEAPESVTEAK